jgi:uncharacterized protein
VTSRCSGVHEPIRGAGIGLRTPHFSALEQDKPAIPWLEVPIDNYMIAGGQALQHLERIRRDYPITFHGVGMSLGSVDPLNTNYLRRLRQLLRRFEPAWLSDHLCWTSVDGHYLHELLPLPYVDEAVQHVSRRIREVQDFLGRRLLIENVSSYLQFTHSHMQEWEFLAAVAEAADCDILLDINNIHVSASNHRFEARHYLDALPVARVRELHLAGYEDCGTHLLDIHGAPVHEPVWALYRQALARFGALPTLIEWDNAIPPLPVLQAEAARAQGYLDEAERDAA